MGNNADVEVLLQKGVNLLNQGRPDEALLCARQVLDINSNDPGAHFLIGLVSLRTMKRDDALLAFGTVTKLQSDNAAAWAYLAEALVGEGRYSEADDALVEAIKHDGGNPLLHQSIALVLSSLDEYEQALVWFQKAAVAQTDNVGFHLNLANCQLFLGQLGAAESTLRHALRLQPWQPNCHWLLAGLATAVDRSHVDDMKALIDSGRFQAPGLSFLHYARGKELEDLQAWDEAFEEIAAGAAAKRSTIDYDERGEIEVFDTLERLYTRAWLDSGSRGERDPAPIFIVGQPRSGTTLVERIITAHTQVHSAGELRQFDDCLRKLSAYEGRQRFAPEAVSSADNVDPKVLGAAYLASTTRFAGEGTHFVDKQPSNFLYVPLILKALPQAKIILLRRGAMDTCFSTFKQLFTSAYPYSYDLEETGRHFARYFKLMNLWHERFGDQIFEVCYEELVGDIEPHAHDLIEYLELPWEDSCLSFHRQKTPVATASAAQVRQKAHTRSIGRWRRYETQLMPLRTVLEAHGVPLE